MWLFRNSFISIIIIMVHRSVSTPQLLCLNHQQFHKNIQNLLVPSTDVTVATQFARIYQNKKHKPPTFLSSSCLSNAHFCLHCSQLTGGPYFFSEFVHLWHLLPMNAAIMLQYSHAVGLPYDFTFCSHFLQIVLVLPLEVCWNSERQYVHFTTGNAPLHSYGNTIRFCLICTIRKLADSASGRQKTAPNRVEKLNLNKTRGAGGVRNLLCTVVGRRTVPRRDDGKSNGNTRTMRHSFRMVRVDRTQKLTTSQTLRTTQYLGDFLVPICNTNCGFRKSPTIFLAFY